MLNETIFNDLKSAMKEKNTEEKSVLQLLRADILQYQKDNKLEVVSDDEIQTIVMKNIKQRNSAINDFINSGCPLFVEKNQKEIEILNKYKPQLLEKNEIETIVERLRVDLNCNAIKDMGKLIKAVKDEVGARGDGKMISDVVKERLSK